MGKTRPFLGEHVQPIDLGGARYYRGAVPRPLQETMVEDIRGIVRAAPLFHPETRRGKMSVRMTSAGAVGWIADRGGYRYDVRHPGGGPWPPIPESCLALWNRFSGCDRGPDTCLVNFYRAEAKMGLHQDRDEASLDWPVLSVSLGDDALFRIGGTERGGPTQSRWLGSGDVVVLQGPSRLAFHGIDRLRTGTSDLLAGGGRINLTLRVAL